MALRAHWKGFLRLALVSCPIKLYTATTSSNTISFHQLHKDTHNRIQQKTWDPELGEVPRKDLVKGYEVEKDKYVVVTPEELDNIKLETNKTIEIEQFVDEAEIGGVYLDKPYFVVPDGPVAQDTYRVIMDGMKKKKKNALGRVVMSGRERLVLISAQGNGMTMTTLRSADEVRNPDLAFEEIPQKKSPPDHVKLVEQLIDQHSGAFQPELFEDRYEAALLELVKSKLAGQEMVVAPEPETAQVIDLMEALRASVADKPAKKPAAKTKRKPAAERKTG